VKRYGAGRDVLESLWDGPSAGAYSAFFALGAGVESVTGHLEKLRRAA